MYSFLHCDLSVLNNPHAAGQNLDLEIWYRPNKKVTTQVNIIKQSLTEWYKQKKVLTDKKQRSR